MKQKKFIRIFALILTVCAIIPFSACQKTGGDTEVTTDTPVTTEEAVDGLLFADENGSCPFVLICAEKTDALSETYMSRFHIQLKALFPDANIKFRYDVLIRDEQPAEFEVLMGKSLREGTEEFQASLPKDTFGIRVSGTKVFIAAYTPSLMQDAFDYFIEHYLVKDEKGRVILPYGDYVSEPKTYSMSDIITSDVGFKAKSTKLYDIPAIDDKRIMQGGCTDGKYMYYAMVGSDKAYIHKYDIETGKVVKISGELATDHTNDITYNPKLNALIVCHNAPNRTVLSIVDADTLEFKRRIGISYSIFSISYQPDKDVYVVGISGGQDFTILDSNFKLDKSYVTTGDRFTAVNTKFTTQGVATDEKYIYFVQYKTNVIMVYDWSGNYVNQIVLDIPSSIEPENISVVGDSFYIGCNNSTWTGGLAYKTQIAPPSSK